MGRIFLPAALLIGLVLAACEPLAMYNPTPIYLIVTGVPSNTPPPTLTPTRASTNTPQPSPTVEVTPSPTPRACAEDEGLYFDITDNRSELTANENLRYRVYVPPCYFSSGRRFPVVYLLHGLSYREQQWEELGLDTALEQGLRLGVLPPMVVVMPYLGNLGQLNSFPPDLSYETFMLEGLLPRVERDLCTWQAREYRAIGGISRGGFLAYSIAMRNPDVFGIVGGHSAYFPNNTAEIPAPFNPLELALNSSLLQEARLRMYMDNGAADSSGPSQQLFSARLAARGIQHTYVVHAVGEHNNDYWAPHVAEYLAFYGRDWPRSYDALPSCAEPSPGT